MNDFKNAYQSAVQDMNVFGMKEIHIDASACMDDKRHKRRVARHVQKVTVTAFSAMCMVFICGFGTVKAAEYIGNVIRVNEWGFESGDAVTMARNETENGQVYVIGDEVKPGPSKKDSISGEEKLMGNEIETEKTGAAETEDADVMLQASAAETECFDESAVPMPAQEETLQKKRDGTETAEDVIEQVEVEEIPVKDYSSWEEFEEKEDIIFPQPSIDMGADMESTNITVCGDWAMARYDVDDKILWIERTDYSDTQGHAASKVFPGGVCNERTYTTSPGYTYTLVDSVRENGEQQQIHAAVTVGSYEVFIDFMGYTEEDAKKILDSIDLSLYEQVLGEEETE